MKIAAFVVILILIAVLSGGYLWLHNYPIKIAKERNHPQYEAIKACAHAGFFLFPLLLVAYIWAYTTPPPLLYSENSRELLKKLGFKDVERLITELGKLSTDDLQKLTEKLSQKES